MRQAIDAVTHGVQVGPHLLAAQRLGEHCAGHGRGTRDGLTPLTVNEIRRRLAALVLTARHTAEHVLAWSDLRRRCIQ